MPASTRPPTPGPTSAAARWRRGRWAAPAALLAGVSPARAAGPTDALFTDFQLAAALFALAILVVVLWVLERTRRRLFRLSDLAEAVDRGDPTERAAEPGTDSIARLSQVVDRLAARTERAVSELEAREAEIRRLAFHDELTGLPNWRLLKEILDKEIAHSRRTGGRIGLAVFDLDDFRAINDSSGHEVGDRLLVAVARRLGAAIRESDTLARLGSDEFALVVTRAVELEDILGTVSRVQADLERPFAVDGREIRLTATAGVGIWPEGSERAEPLLRQAETALHHAQREGRHGLRIFHPSMTRLARRTLDLETDLRHALSRSDQLVLYLQPQVALADGRLIGMEGLVRWRHPQRGLLTAGAFIPLAEKTGLMPELGRRLLADICSRLARWQREGLGGIPVTVNVSARQFQAGGFEQEVGEAVAAAGIPPGMLHLEITESIALHDVERMTAALGRIHELGVEILLDDFGTGYSSLSYLLRYPVDGIKIDRTFVAGAPDNQHCAAIVRATLALARALDLRVIAEGVETEEQLDLLRGLGCEAAQGYLFGHPGPPEEMEELLRAGRLPIPGAGRFPARLSGRAASE